MSSAAGTPPTSPRQDPYAVFRPRRGRVVALVASVAAFVVFAGGAVTLPRADPLFGGWTLSDRLMLVALGSSISLLMWRYASIRAIPSRQGIVVRNLFTTRSLEWPEVVRVQFGGGAPWVTLDLDDTDTLAVMAIQKADGAVGRSEAGRLAALVQAHSLGGGRRPR